MSKFNVNELTHKDVCPYFEDNCVNVGCACPKFQAYEAVNDPKQVADEIKAMGIDPNSDPLTLMMEMQKLFAAKFHKVDNFTKDEVDHWVKAYDICITDEICEVHEHLNLFPGVEAKDNNVELQKEFIDIWHFLMDEFIVADMNAQVLVDKYVNHRFAGTTTDFMLERFNGDALEMIFNTEYNALNKHFNGELSVLNKNDRDLQILIYSNLILAGMRSVRQQISWKHWKKPSATIDYNALQDAFLQTFIALIQCFIITGLDAKELTDIYIKKNLENRFRQQAGY